MLMGPAIGQSPRRPHCGVWCENRPHWAATGPQNPIQRAKAVQPASLGISMDMLHPPDRASVLECVHGHQGSRDLVITALLALLVSDSQPPVGNPSPKAGTQYSHFPYFSYLFLLFINILVSATIGKLSTYYYLL